MIMKEGPNHVAGGGEGMGRIEDTTAAISKAVGPDCQVVAICGRNRKLVARMQARYDLLR